MNRFDRVVAGLSCREVLHRLSDFLDGELAPDDRAAVLSHLEGCSTCESFGGRVGRLVAGLRATGQTTPVPEGVSERLRRRMASGAA